MFDNRFDAGRRLAPGLGRFHGHDLVVVALPRGGVPVGYELARAFDAPLEVLVVRKLGAPGSPEFGIGAIAQGALLYLDDELVERLEVTPAYLDAEIRKELAEMDRRARLYRGSRGPLDVADRTVILVDDGLASGAMTRAAARALYGRSAYSVVLAVPVCARSAAREMRGEVDAIVCLENPERPRAMGDWFSDFTPTRDDEVVALLARAERERRGEAA